MAKKFDRDLLLDCATELLDYLALQDPMYGERIQITKDERGYDNLQIALQYMSRVLDLGEHMVFVEREFMNPGYIGHLGPRECSICHVEFTPSRASDTVCSRQSCLDNNAAQLDAEFEQRSTAGAR